MKLAVLAQAGSRHTERWCLGLKSRGLDLCLFSNSRIIRKPPGVETVFFPGRSKVDYLINIPRVRKALAAYGPDLVHAHYATSYGLWGVVQNAAPLILSVWGTDITDARKRPFTIGAIVRKALKRAAAVTATSICLQEETADFYPPAKDKIVHIPFGVDIPEPITSAKGENEPLTFIFAKAFVPNYDPEVTIRAYVQARAQMPSSRLIMIGGGPLKKNLVRLAGELKTAGDIIIEDWVEPDRALRLIAGADVMVMPSRKESFGVAALEAAAAGLPVIATAVGGIPEIVHHEVNGILVQPADVDGLAAAMIRLANDGELRRRMGAAGQKLAEEKYRFSVCLDRMMEVYRKVLG